MASEAAGSQREWRPSSASMRSTTVEVSSPVCWVRSRAGPACSRRDSASVRSRRRAAAPTLNAARSAATDSAARRQREHRKARQQRKRVARAWPVSAPASSIAAHQAWPTASRGAERAEQHHRPCRAAAGALFAAQPSARCCLDLAPIASCRPLSPDGMRWTGRRLNCGQSAECPACHSLELTKLVTVETVTIHAATTHCRSFWRASSAARRSSWRAANIRSPGWCPIAQPRQSGSSEHCAASSRSTPSSSTVAGGRTCRVGGTGLNLLLDTHAFLWWIAGDTTLSQTDRAAIADEGNAVFVSAATAWEIATKFRFGKLPGVAAIVTDLAVLDTQGFRPLPISFDTGKWPAHCPVRCATRSTGC